MFYSSDIVLHEALLYMRMPISYNTTCLLHDFIRLYFFLHRRIPFQSVTHVYTWKESWRRLGIHPNGQNSRKWLPLIMRDKCKYKCRWFKMKEQDKSSYIEQQPPLACLKWREGNKTNGSMQFHFLGLTSFLYERQGIHLKFGIFVPYGKTFWMVPTI